MSVLLGGVLLASLLGSLHCAGMCGPFVAFYAGTDGRGGWLGHLAYNGGRLLTYATLGAAAGALGAGIDVAGSSIDLQRLAGLVAGSLMVLWGAAMLLPSLGVRWPARAGEGRVERRLRGALRRLSERPPVVRGLALGGLTTLLPCGWLYAFVVGAAGTGSAGRGAAVMAAFWLGTVPVMLGLGLGLQRAARFLGRSLPIVTATAVMAIGIIGLVARLAMPAHHHTADSAHAQPPPPGAASTGTTPQSAHDGH